MALWISFACLTAMLAYMGWIVYRTNRSKPPEELRGPKFKPFWTWRVGIDLPPYWRQGITPGRTA